jgi:hypothetical protein
LPVTCAGFTRAPQRDARRRAARGGRLARRAWQQPRVRFTGKLGLCVQFIPALATPLSISQVLLLLRGPTRVPHQKRRARRATSDARPATFEPTGAGVFVTLLPRSSGCGRTPRDPHANLAEPCAVPPRCRRFGSGDRAGHNMPQARLSAAHLQDRPRTLRCARRSVRLRRRAQRTAAAVPVVIGRIADASRDRGIGRSC